MPNFGYALLLICFVVTIYTAAAAVIGHLRRSSRLLASANYGVYALFGLLSASSLTLMYLFIVGDYSVKYVQAYSDRSMPLFYKATAMWGGQDGSLLFWVWVMSIWAAIAVYQNRNRNRELMPYTIVAMMWVTLFFVSLLVFVANPFETYLGGSPTDGRGLNPLLQNPYMVTHPPSLYLGYIGWTIPYCFAMGALAHGKLDYGWIASMRRWCLVAWVSLTIGLMLGGLWAYEELGWGGYWAWDPVENAAFMPWLTGTAFIHSVQVQERRGIFKGWNMILIIITFILTLLGTMMTRSGIVQSVHAFAQSEIGDVFLTFLFVTIAVSLGLVLYRRRELEPEGGLESIVSREFAFLANNWVLLVAAFAVTFATLFPALYKWLSGGQEVNVGPAFYNVWMIPIGLVLLFLTGVGPLLSWRKSTGATLLQQFLGPAILAVLSAIPLGWINAYHFNAGLDFVGGLLRGELVTPNGPEKAILTLVLCVFVFATIAQELSRGTWYRMKNAKENVVDAFLTLIGRARRRYGGYVVHFGIVLMFVGFAGEAYKLSSQQTLKPGESTAIGKYEVRLDRLTFEDDGQKNMATAHVTVLDRETKGELGKMAPAKWAYRKPENQVTTEVDKRMTMTEDLYLVLGGMDERTSAAVLELKINPLVNFVWLGCTFLMFGFAIAVWPDRRTAPVQVFSRRTAMATAGWASLVLALLSAMLAFI